MPAKKTKNRKEKALKNRAEESGEEQGGRISISRDEGKVVIFANAADVVQQPGEALLRFANMDSRDRICSHLFHIHYPIIPFVDWATRQLGDMGPVMARWAECKYDRPDLQAATSEFHGEVETCLANMLLSAVSSVGARMTFQWLDPHAIAMKSSEIDATPVLTVRMQPELCGWLWTRMAEEADRAPGMPIHSHLGRIDARFAT